MSRYIKIGDTVALALSFFTKAGTAVALTGHTVKLLITERYNPSAVLKEVSVEVFSGEGNNLASVIISDEDTALIREGRHDRKRAAGIHRWQH